MARSRGAELVVVIALCALRPWPLGAQGGWRAWDIVMRDGQRVEANPLGAPDDAHLAISVGGMEGHDRTIARRRVALVAAQATIAPGREPLPGDPLPPRPTRRACEDVIVRRNGRTTLGHVSLTRIRYSTGIVTQRGVEISLDSVAYIAFGDATATRCRRKPRGATRARAGTP